MYNSDGTLKDGADDTTNHNWFGLSPDDNNDVYSNGETTKTFKQLKKEIEKSSLSDKEKERLLEKLRSQSKK